MNTSQGKRPETKERKTIQVTTYYQYYVSSIFNFVDENNESYLV